MSAPATRLSVNLNKIALLRNTRQTGVPDVEKFGRIALAAGAGGLTVHPRPDRRHIRDEDVRSVARLMADYPAAEFNIEGYPGAGFLALVTDVRPTQCTLVPDAWDAVTSDTGWDIPGSRPLLERSVSMLKAAGIRVILFMDPSARMIERVPETGADGVEIYTGTYAAAFRRGTYREQLDQCVAAAAKADQLGLVVNAGHDLNLRNLPPLLSRASIHEVSIGHELTADALRSGFAATVRRYAAVVAKTVE